MATAITSPASGCEPTPPPCACPPPPPKFNLGRFLRKTMWFIEGTFGGIMDGMAHGGRIGFFIGLAATALWWIATTMNPMALFVLAGGGLVLGAVTGAIAGAVGGGIARIEQGRKREEETGEVESGLPGLPALHDISADRDRVGDFNFERQMQQERENVRDLNTYWQDKMHPGHNHSSAPGPTR